VSPDDAAHRLANHEATGGPTSFETPLQRLHRNRRERAYC